ncbi:MAG: DegT/DnrJ/EryC1/StrS family aminotransferase [Planctomycetes bacterium]|nr:DegT/DnrJ/EryC1/StrS family aminotransferase [Planctomycetota bacterium]
MGPEVDGLEAECAALLGCKHAIGVSSGTDALLAALMALCVGPGDEVICPTYTFFATAGTIWRTGAKPVFVDSDPVTYNCVPEQIEAAITDRTRAIMPVHLFGQCADMDPIVAIGQKHGIPVVEDAAQAISARYGDRCAGTIGVFGCFSFFPSKNLGCLGDGGLVTTNDDEHARIARAMRNHGMEPKYHHHFVGGNFRIDALQAALLRIKLPHLAPATAGRRRNAQLYTEAFAAHGVASDSPTAVPPDRIGLPVAVRDHIYNQFVIRTPRREALREFLASRKIGHEVYYPVPMHMQECFRTLGHAAGQFPVAERAAAETLALPVFPELSEAEVAYVADAVAAFCKGA